jgi:hypothetical protein
MTEFSRESGPPQSPVYVLSIVYVLSLCIFTTDQSDKCGQLLIKLDAHFWTDLIFTRDGEQIAPPLSWHEAYLGPGVRRVPDIINLTNCRCCDITVDSTTPVPWNGACTERWISKQMRHIMLMFHNCSPYKVGLLQKGCIILYFKIKTKSLKFDAVTKKCLLTDSLLEQIHFKHNCLVLRPLSDDDVKLHALLSNTVHRIMMHCLECRPCRIHRFVAAPNCKQFRIKKISSW